MTIFVENCFMAYAMIKGHDGTSSSQMNFHCVIYRARNSRIIFFLVELEVIFCYSAENRYQYV